jgi:hypothetical protein
MQDWRRAHLQGDVSDYKAQIFLIQTWITWSGSKQEKIKTF